MDTNSQFSVNVTDHDRISFADLSGDYNPLHVDANYAKNTDFNDSSLVSGAIIDLSGGNIP
jgi:acyl dehydratase